MTENKPKYNFNENESTFEQGTYANTYGQPEYPANYTYRSTNDLYEDESSGTGSFLAGAIVGGVIGAATALFLAPKTGREMREDFTTQASQLKDKSIELSSTAKEKAVELSTAAKDKTVDLTGAAKEKTAAITSAAKDKTSELSQTIQEQSGQLVEKVKSATSKTTVPMDDGTVSSEGEEATDYKSMKQSKEESGNLSKANDATSKKNEKVSSK
ncbi:YtxH domain-containing protein [Sporosarcina obsidiansis]|uniref:YtxH domain-containing protein n=1 Tax=Sporosarcina obsidiansis TaxID=2660748 RepID=UPI00129A4012|nr:YtxH domain-containing protein [Sporosarcina obsidiansis]